MHSPLMADRTDIKGFPGEAFVSGFPVKYLGIGFGRWDVQEQAAKRKPIAALTVGQKAEVADFSEAVGKDVDEKSADELLGVESHEPNAIVLFAISPLERNFAVCECLQAVVGNSDAVRIAAEIIENLSRTAKGWLGIDDPFLFVVSA